MKKVAHICTSAYSHKILLDKLELLKDKGYQIDLISSREGLNEELIKDYTINFKYVYMNRKINLIDDVKSIIKMYQLIRREDYDVVHTHTAKAGILGRIAAKISGVEKIIHTTHGLPYYEEQSRIQYNLFKNFERIGALFCDYVASQNEEDLKKLENIIPKEKLLYEGNGIHTNYLEKLKCDISKDIKKEILNQYGVDNDNILILVAARFERVKNHELLLRSLKILKNKFEINNFICLLAGEGYLQEEICEKIKSLKLEKDVMIIGYKNNIYDYIKASDIVALTSIKEGLPRIIMEAMFFKKPIIATNVLGTRELISNDKNGYLSGLDKPEDLAGNFYKLIKSKELRKNFGEKGRKIIEKKYTEQLVVDRIDRFYNL